MQGVTERQVAFPDVGAFRRVSSNLASLNYFSVQYMPGSRRPGLGAELSIFSCFLLQRGTAILRGSYFYSAYRKLSRYFNPESDALLSLFFDCHPMTADLVTKLLEPEELREATKQGILYTVNDNIVSNFRFVPIDRMMVACSPTKDYNKDDFVYIGSDTLMFRDLIANRISKHVDRTLEIGCGTGFLSIWMAARSDSVIATDISPRALSMTRANAAINGSSNLTPVASDVYSNVAGEFNVIISNPPYMFLPDEESKRLHAYGGHFGLDITRRILLGLDAHLSADGVALIFSDSYLLDDGSNTLCNLLLAMLEGQPWNIVATQFDYQPVRGHADFYRRHNVRHAIRYLITIRRSKSFEFSHEKLSTFSRAIQNIKLWKSKSY